MSKKKIYIYIYSVAAKFGVDTGENGPSKSKIIFIVSFREKLIFLGSPFATILFQGVFPTL